MSFSTSYRTAAGTNVTQQSTYTPTVGAALGRILGSAVLLLTLLVCSNRLQGSEAVDPAWRSFQQARGEPALIGANPDHGRAGRKWRPIAGSVPPNVDPERFRLGFDLFHEGRLSSGNSVACVTCHAGALSGADRRPVSTGVGRARGTMNALSVFNAGYNFRQFWDGRAVTLEDQALEPIRNPVEMANTLDAVLEMLRGDPDYRERFARIYPDGVTINNVADAIAHFQRINFVRLDTPFQRYLNGEEEALDEQQKRGLMRFEEVGCAGCHNGINMGGNSYQKLGAAIPYYGEERQAGPYDVGIMARSFRERDRHVFRVPPLHGVATTSPYFHDGSVATLQDAIQKMAEHQLGRELLQQDVVDIEAFLQSLGGFFTARRAPEYEAEGQAAHEADQRNGQKATTTLESHPQAYRESIRAMESAGEQLLVEMRRIREGDVEHYDFLQFQHLQLIRHARALQHPPSSLNEQKRRDLDGAAQTVLPAVSDLEWLIADFLRAEAMIRVFAAHGTASIRGTVLNGAGDPARRLREQRSRSEELISDMEAAGPGQLASSILEVYAHGE